MAGGFFWSLDDLLRGLSKIPMVSGILFKCLTTVHYRILLQNRFGFTGDRHIYHLATPHPGSRNKLCDSAPLSCERILLSNLGTIQQHDKFGNRESEERDYIKKKFPTLSNTAVNHQQSRGQCSMPVSRHPLRKI